ncbi:FAD-binding domain-containing protein [Macrolepiota fuliginosa MF-IS2]|uniref:FAD-binding domain-containing protein n=1 Tax=Macrolepiota fuliginosa MF-IS2 TaxID=1400762 RepID=A0A9P6C6E5_9AGAR|nr:FAD-binding domain-containing protein [Macrolepiota fuliginosa MF-IS2]
MRFRSLLDLVPFLPAILAQTGNSSKGSTNCRCLYGQSCWPSEQDFSSLSAQLSQPLIRPVPPASACYPVGNPSGNCSDVQQNWSDANWRADQPGAYENINFETYTNRNDSISGCYLNTTLGLPCDQGSVPPIGVDARTVEDVQAAVRFAGQHNLRLVVKNTGHDYLGRSAGRNAFMIWTHHLKNISYDGNFIPEGASNNEVVPALTLGAGVQWREAYAAAAEQQRFITGGISSGMSVGAAGGWVMGGGHSAFSAKYGLGVDNAVQFTIVKADGDHVIANAHNNSDLFWALRGGGAGSWGVVTSVTYKTYDLVPLVMSVINAVMLAYTVETWTAGDSGDIVRQARQRIAQEVRRLDPISPDSATYMNEASLYEPDFRKSFFGSHYDRLRSIKRKYDPGSLFLVAEGVGSEDWDGSLICPV